jgi:hypothetical protein
MTAIAYGVTLSIAGPAAATLAIIACVTIGRASPSVTVTSAMSSAARRAAPGYRNK